MTIQMLGQEKKRFDREARTRLLAFVVGIALSLLAIYSYIATVQMIIHNPALVLPDSSLWTVAQLESALAEMGLPVTFFAVYALVITLVFSLTFLACGWLILLRRSQDLFGLFLASLLLSWANGVGVFVSMPASPRVEGVHLGWFMWPGLFLLLYLFPSGHVTPRWARWFAWSWGVFVIYGMAADFLGVLPDNFTYFIPLLFSVLLVGGYAQIYRYRHAGVLERQQVRVVVFSLILFVAFFIFWALNLSFTGLVDPGRSSLTGALFYAMLFSTTGYLVFMGIPVSLTLAILRYRLWDIDVIIRRTLVYSTLTLTLGLVYLGSVVLLQSLFTAASGESSTLALVISTLGIAALFTPLHRRIQRDIDRRFYRRKYDAEKTLAAFAASARDEVELENLAAALLSVVQETMQPEQVSIWLNKSNSRRSS